MKKIIGILCVLMLMSTLPTVTGLIVDSNYQINACGSNGIDWWSMYRHDLGHSGYSTSDAPETANLKWSNSYVSSSAIDFDSLIVNDKIYITPNSIYAPGTGSLFCLDIENGTTIWSKPELGINSLCGSVISVDSQPRIYVSGIDDLLRANIWCFDAETGNQKWSYVWIGSFLSFPFTPMYNNGKLYFFWLDLTWEGSYSIHVRCVKDHGSYGLIKWDKVVDNILINENRYFPNVVPTIADGKVYILTDFKIYRFDAETGKKDWEVKRSKMSDLSLVVVDNKIYFGEQGYVTCLNANNGSEVWSKKLDSSPRVVLSPTVVDEKVYVGFIKYTYSTYVYCLNDTNGAVLWSKHLFDSTNEYTYVSPTTVADEKIYIAGGESSNWGKVYCLDTDDGNIIWNSSLDASVTSSVSIANGALYICTRNGTLYKFEDLYQNHPPNKPDIDGPTYGAVGIEYSYIFVSTDPDSDDIASFEIDWDDVSGIEVVEGPFSSSEEISVDHAWSEKGSYSIRAKAIDINGAESDWGILDVTIPKNKAYKNNLFEWFFNHFQDAFPILQQLLGL